MPDFNRPLLLLALTLGIVASASADELDTLIYKMGGITPPPAAPAPASALKVTTHVPPARNEPEAPKPTKSPPTVTNCPPQAISATQQTPALGTNAAGRTSTTPPAIALPPRNSPTANLPPARTDPPAYTPPPATQPPPPPSI